jgi:hypothetical protein
MPGAGLLGGSRRPLAPRPYERGRLVQWQGGRCLESVSTMLIEIVQRILPKTLLPEASMTRTLNMCRRPLRWVQQRGGYAKGRLIIKLKNLQPPSGAAGSASTAAAAPRLPGLNLVQPVQGGGGAARRRLLQGVGGGSAPAVYAITDGTPEPQKLRQVQALPFVEWASLDLRAYPAVLPPGSAAAAEAAGHHDRVSGAARRRLAQAAGALQLNDPRLGDQWHHGVVDSPHAWALARGGGPARVCIVDTGMQRGHPDLPLRERCRPWPAREPCGHALAGRHALAGMPCRWRVALTARPFSAGPRAHRPPCPFPPPQKTQRLMGGVPRGASTPMAPRPCQRKGTPTSMPGTMCEWRPCSPHWLASVPAPALDALRVPRRGVEQLCSAPPFLQRPLPGSVQLARRPACRPSAPPCCRRGCMLLPAAFPCPLQVVPRLARGRHRGGARQQRRGGGGARIPGRCWPPPSLLQLPEPRLRCPAVSTARGPPPPHTHTGLPTARQAC